ncbi:MAG: hypothetical protein JXB14_04130, partial [Candidatus Altiarchaeota archaeon]|nr:hypothetical protein [Candidatus Altiarchaeota archaeon]
DKVLDGDYSLAEPELNTGEKDGESCKEPMRGVICAALPSEADLVLEGNYDQMTAGSESALTQGDVDVFNRLMGFVDGGALDSGADWVPIIESIMDFNRDAVVDSKDYDCLVGFKDRLGEVLPPRELRNDCFKIYFGINLGVEPVCLASSEKGDLNSNGLRDSKGPRGSQDEVLYQFVLGEGYPNILDPALLKKDESPIDCWDLKIDGQLTEPDLTCLRLIFVDGDSSTSYMTQCHGCDSPGEPGNMPSEVFWPDSEICNDEWDNNCDGYRDLYYYQKDESKPDRCICSEAKALTPWNLYWEDDANLGLDLDDPDGYKVCRNLGSARTGTPVFDGWDWVTPEVPVDDDPDEESRLGFECNIDNQCKVVQVQGETQRRSEVRWLEVNWLTVFFHIFCFVFFQGPCQADIVDFDICTQFVTVDGITATYCEFYCTRLDDETIGWIEKDVFNFYKEQDPWRVNAERCNDGWDNNCDGRIDETPCAPG